MTEAMKINHFHSLLRRNALQSFVKSIRQTSKDFVGSTSSLSTKRSPNTIGTDW